jgi:hypothetical protein
MQIVEIGLPDPVHLLHRFFQNPSPARAEADFPGNGCNGCGRFGGVAQRPTAARRKRGVGCVSSGKYCGSMSISDQLRRIIESSGQSWYRIAVESGVQQSSLSRFMRGERGLTTDSLDKIGAVLGLELKVRKKGGKPRGDR